MTDFFGIHFGQVDAANVAVYANHRRQTGREV